MTVMLLTLLIGCVCGNMPAVILTATATAPSIPVTGTTPPSTTPTEDESTRLVDWLTKYGYLPPSDTSTGQLQAWSAVTQAVKAMQKFAGLEETGVMDEETLRLLQTPRCSLPDSDMRTNQQLALRSNGSRHRTKRAVSTWTRRNINWRLRSYPNSATLSREMIRSLVFYALRVWAEPTPLEFHEVGGPEGADLQVDFLRGSHGDGYPFDGVGGAVGHAFFPSDPDRAGGVHLDAEEQWTFRQPASEGTDLFTVLVHELGHALGLSHSSARRSVMRPYYQGPLGDPLHFHLGPQDVEHITALYGKRSNQLPTDGPSVATEPRDRHRYGEPDRNPHKPWHGHELWNSHAMDRCNTSFDAVAKIRGETFFFKGMSMWRVSRGGLVSLGAVSVRRLWRALPPSLPPLRAVLERPSDHAIIFISGSQFWLFKDLSLQEGSPQPLSALYPGKVDRGPQGLLCNAEEGVLWGNISEGGEENGGGEEESEIWRELIRGGVNGIILERDDSIYLFKGRSYWKFSHPGSNPLEGYPRPLATDWLDCPHPSPYQPSDISLTSPIGGQELWKRKGQTAISQIRQEDKTTEWNSQEYRNCPCLSLAAISTVSHYLLMPTMLLIISHCVVI